MPLNTVHAHACTSPIRNYMYSMQMIIIIYLSIQSYSQFPPIPPSQVGQSMEWSIWSIQPTAPHPHTPSHPHTHTHSHPHTHPHILTDSMVGSTLQLHQVHTSAKIIVLIYKTLLYTVSPAWFESLTLLNLQYIQTC